MPGYCFTALFFVMFLTYVNGQVTCPTCSNKYDPDSCTGTKECGVGWNWCELHVHTSDFYSLEYLCQDYNDCVNHEIYGCHPEANETCFYCCEDTVTCQIQRDDLYTYVFPNAGPPATPTTAPPPTEPTVPGPAFSCPRCTDPYDHTSCTGTLSCSSDAYDVCQLQVQPADSNKVAFTCQKYQDCSSQEALGCHTNLNQACTYCCLDPVACQHQIDYLFDFVFLPQPATHLPRP